MFLASPPLPWPTLPLRAGQHRRACSRDLRARRRAGKLRRRSPCSAVAAWCSSLPRSGDPPDRAEGGSPPRPKLIFGCVPGRLDPFTWGRPSGSTRIQPCTVLSCRARLSISSATSGKQVQQHGVPSTSRPSGTWSPCTASKNSRPQCAHLLISSFHCGRAAIEARKSGTRPAKPATR